MSEKQKFSPLTYELIRRQETNPSLMDVVAVILKISRQDVTVMLEQGEIGAIELSEYAALKKISKDDIVRKELAREALQYVSLARNLG